MTFCTLIRSPAAETKNHWARDDPGFAVLQAFFLVVRDTTTCILFESPAPPILFNDGAVCLTTLRALYFLSYNVRVFVTTFLLVNRLCAVGFFLFEKVATFAFGVAFGARGVWTYVGLLLHSVGIHWLLCGVVMSSFCRCGFGQHEHWGRCLSYGNLCIVYEVLDCVLCVGGGVMPADECVALCVGGGDAC